MYCNKSLRTNKVVEEFPVGRRLAFDAAKGRLWVVCRRCERWNLTPLEERWEAVETCEKLFRATRIRTSTENIGLARHSEGLELVRIGKPLRPEFAAWRYGDQFGRRRRRAVAIGTGAFLAGAGGMVLGGALAGLGGIGFGTFIYQSINGWNMFRPSVFFRPEDGRLRWMNRFRALWARLRPSGGESDFSVEVKAKGLVGGKQERFEGEDAVRVLHAILPRVNADGGSRKTVQAAVTRIERAGQPDRIVRSLAHLLQYRYSPAGVQLSALEKHTTLALEMALHEEQERRALQGELWILERAWKEAEEIAAISDNLFLPAGTDAFLDRYRRDG
ncbi:MAG: hypothetical protein OXR82_12490 [Gammaproteobacteria bacterium]|nr:hypothetical protein [Gammaproteobacteria bacterium]MDE0259189.1 hypothetical protein [Gammaproteobacteria bacterium]